MQSSTLSTPVSQPVPVKVDSAFDLGNSDSKLRATGNQTITFRSILAPLSTANQMGNWPNSDVIFFEGAWWVAGEATYIYASDAVQENTTVSRYTSAWYRTLFAFALHKVMYSYAGQGAIRPRIISSIPAEIYKNRTQTNEIKQHLTGHYSIRTVSGQLLEVDVEDRKFTIVPEGIGTYFECVYGPQDGINYGELTVSVWDLGYLTLDMILMQKNQYAPTLSKSDEHTGTGIVATSIRDYIFQQRRVRLGRSEIDAAMFNDEIQVHGNSIAIGDVRDKALAELGQRMTTLTEQWLSGLNVDLILLTGGGAKYILPYLQLPPYFPPIKLGDRLSNVNGAYAYLTQGTAR